MLPESDEAIAFLSVSELAPLLKSKKLSSRRLTEIYLARLKKYGNMLRCVISLLEESALERADAMDAEISAGRYRGPLHGIPWGAKDLIDVEGTKTSWGIPYHEDRESETTATVAERLDDAGAVLVAKLSLGALAMGDKWFRGMTRNPWNPTKGSSGSSAGSASAVIAGLVGFTLGSETLGSITSPSKVCGASGFRPTFGRVSRHGCMPLSWTMDKIGPLCRSAEDCAIVFNAIHGADGRDQSTYTYDFQWPRSVDFRKLRVGYNPRRKIESSQTLKQFKELGCEMIEFELPQFDTLRAMSAIIDIEASSVFDRMLRDGETEGWNTWPGSLRSAQFVSAVDYLRLQRHRVELMEAVEEKMKDVDVIVNIRDVFHTNFTGHPSIVVPTRYRERKSGGTIPICSTFTGHLGDDDRLLAIAHKFQQHCDAHLQHPELDPWLEKFEAGTLDEPPQEGADKTKQKTEAKSSKQ
jgi:Asp-tRNA(Asn)/Glu-tRNA(Gln) amidotransferase A subunit family amidase